MAKKKSQTAAELAETVLSQCRTKQSRSAFHKLTPLQQHALTLIINQVEEEGLSVDRASKAAVSTLGLNVTWSTVSRWIRDELHEREAFKSGSRAGPKSNRRS